MRRFKIKPSINLASRRSVPGTTQAKEKATPATPAPSKNAQPSESSSKSSMASGGRVRPSPSALRNKTSDETDAQDERREAAKCSDNVESISIDGRDDASLSTGQAPEVQKPSETPIKTKATDKPSDSGPTTLQEATSDAGSEQLESTDTPSQEPSVSPQPSSSSPPQPSAAASQETADKAGAGAGTGRRRRFAVVPNLGQRSRPPVSSKVAGHRSRPVVSKVVGQKDDEGIITPTGPVVSGGDGGEQENTEGEEGGQPTLPPPVQRVLVAPGGQKKAAAARPVLPPVGVQRQHSSTTKHSATNKDQDATPFKTPAVPVVSHSTKSDVTGEGKGKVSEADGKRAPSGHLQTHQDNVYSKKLKELKDQIDEETPSKRRKSHPKSRSPDRTKMTMSDLIYYNPKSNPMKVSEAEKQNKKARNAPKRTDDGNQKKVTFANGEENEKEERDENAPVDSMAPQVKIGPNGEIIIDQSSLVVEASPARTFDPSESTVVHEDSSNTTYSSFLKRKRTATWTAKDTARFFKALSAVGTDFTLINALFPTRTRAEIKRKFKREERIDRMKIDTALLEKKELEMSVFDLSPDEDEEDAATKKKKKGRAGVKAALNNGQITKERIESSDKTAERDEDARSEASVDGAGNSQESQDDTEGETDMTNILSTTRYGRKPKVRNAFTIEIPPKQMRKRTRASPSQAASSIKAFDSYAINRLQRLQQEHEAALARKRSSGNGEEEEEEDDRSDATSEVMSEVGSEYGNGELQEIAGGSNIGLSNGLQTNFMMQSTPPVRPIINQPSSVGGFSSPEANLNDPAVKKVMLLITTPDGKKTFVQVNLTPSQDTGASSVVPSPSGSTSSQMGIAGHPTLGTNHSPGIVHTPARTLGPGANSSAGFNTTVRTPVQASMSTPHTVGMTPVQLASPAARLTTLSNVSSPYQRVSPQSHKINTIINQGGTQPSRQSKNVTSAKIVDGKIVFCAPQPTVSPGSLHNLHQISQNLNTSSQLSRQLGPGNQIPGPNTSLPKGMSFHTQPQDHVYKPSVSSLPFRPSVPIINEQRVAMTTVPLPPPMTTEHGLPALMAASVATEHLLPIDTLQDLDVNLPLSSNLDVVTYEETIPLMGDPIVAQNINVASTNLDGTLPPQRKRKHNSKEPFVPQIR